MRFCTNCFASRRSVLTGSLRYGPPETKHLRLDLQGSNLWRWVGFYSASLEGCNWIWISMKTPWELVYLFQWILLHCLLLLATKNIYTYDLIYVLRLYITLSWIHPGWHGDAMKVRIFLHFYRENKRSCFSFVRPLLPTKRSRVRNPVLRSVYMKPQLLLQGRIDNEFGLGCIH